MTALERFRLMGALIGLLICASLVGCSSHDGSAAAAVASSSVPRSILTSTHTVTPGHTTGDGGMGSWSQSSLAATTGPATADSQTTGPPNTDKTTMTSAGSCNPTLILFDFEPVEPTYTYPYPQGAAVPSSCAGVGEAGTITMQVGDSVRMTVQQPGLHVGPLSATPHNLVKLSGDVILAEHTGTAHIYTGGESMCRLIGVSKSRCELLTLKIGS